MKSGGKPVTCGIVAAGLFLSFGTSPKASGQPAQVGLVAQVQGAGNILHLISDLEKSLAFYNDTLGLKLNRAPRGPADHPTAYIKLLPIIGPMYLASPDAMYRSAEIALASKEVRLEMEDFKDVGTKNIRRKLTDPGATLMSLTVRDLDAIAMRLAAAHSDIVTPGGKPMTVKTAGGPQRQLVVKDPDGYFILLAQANEADKASPAGTGSPDVTNLRMAITVEDLDATMHFYRDNFGFQPSEPTPFGTGLEVAGLKGVQYKTSESVIPGTQLHFDYVEFKGVPQKTYHPSIHDVGATILRLGFPDVNALTQNLRNAGIPVISTTGQPTQIFIIARAPDDLYIQFFARPI
jgi:catechol 2,3-dioxygenase-like lactoylglutathione lyase family enzyme